MNILFIGDIVGKNGRRAVREMTPALRSEFMCSFVVVNAENAAGGAGVTEKCLKAFMPDPVDVATSGDHVWDQKCFANEIAGLKNVLRPYNCSPKQPGNGYGVFRDPAGAEIAVINLQGRVFMKNIASCPFEAADRALREIGNRTPVVIVDMHAEATSEKAALAYYLDGRVTAVFGTHTHVQTSDEKILPRGTAFISDVGMVGAEYSILGRTVDSVVERFTSGMPNRMPVEDTNIKLEAAVVSYNPKTGKADSIKRLRRPFKPHVS